MPEFRGVREEMIETFDEFEEFDNVPNDQLANDLAARIIEREHDERRMEKLAHAASMALTSKTTSDERVGDGRDDDDDDAAVAVDVVITTATPTNPVKKRVVQKKLTSPSATTTTKSDSIVLPPKLKVNKSTAGGYSKGEKLAMFRACYPNAAEIGQALVGLRVVLEEFEMFFDRSSGLTITGMNTSHSLYADLNVPASAFVVFNLRDADDSEIVMPTCARFSVRAESLFKLRKEFAEDYSLTFCTLLGVKAGVREEIHLQLHPAKQSNARSPNALFGVEQIDAEHEQLRAVEPWSLYQFRVTMRTVHLRSLLTQFLRYGDTAFHLSNRGLDIIGFDGEGKTSGSKNINYTSETRRDTVLSAYDVFKSYRLRTSATQTDEERRHVAPSEHEIYRALRAEGNNVMLCHLDRLVRRRTTCSHMDCLAGKSPINPTTGKPEVNELTGEPIDGPPTCVRHTTTDGGDDTNGPVICLQDEPLATRMSAIDSIRFRSIFLNNALATLLEAEHIELFFGRLDPPDDDVFCPLLMRGRTLDATGRLIMMENSVYVVPCEHEK